MPIFETVNANDSLMHLLSGVIVINKEVIHYSQLKKTNIYVGRKPQRACE